MIALDERVLGQVEKVFEENFRTGGELGASVSLWQDGRERLALHRGYRDSGRTVSWDEETLVPLWSATKGLAAAACLLAMEDSGVVPEQPVADVWPGFAGSGKAGISIADVLAHRAGLAVLDRDVSVFEYDDVIAAIEAQPSRGRAGGHGYHPRTYGFILDELVRRLAGVASLGEYWRSRIAEPLDLELWIGLPETEFGRVAELSPARGMVGDAGEARDFYRALGDPDSNTRKAFGSPRGLHSVREMNRPDSWKLGLPAMGGVGSAHALAKFYAVLAGGGDGERFFSESVLLQMETALSSGADRTFLMPTAFAAGFMKDPEDAAGEKLRLAFGASTRAFGHPGAGGSLAFADPENGIAFAYVMNQMELGVMPNVKSLAMVEAVYG